MSSSAGRQRDRLPLAGARGAAVGTLAVALAGIGHLAGGGTLSLTPLVLLIVVGSTVATALSRRAWRLPQLVLALALGQWLSHLVFMGWPEPGASGMDQGMAGMPPMANMPTMGTAMATGRASVQMIVAHVGATLLAALVLRRGEQALQSTVRLMRRNFAAPAAVPAVPAWSRPPRIGTVIILPGLGVLASSRWGRAPPTGALH